MMFKRYIYFLIAVLLVGCTADETPEPEKVTEVYVVPYVQAFKDVEQGTTRALPPGYEALVPDEDMQIELFLTSGEQETAGTLNYDRTSGKWRSSLELEAGKSYKVYGYMQKAGTNHSVAYTDNGINLTLNNLSPLVGNDPCVITGVLQGDKDTGPIGGTDIRRGKFDYVGETSANGNYIYLLFDHFYAGLDFQFKVDAEYSTLRKIKLKEVRLTTNQVETVSAHLQVRGNDTGENPITNVGWTSTGGNQEQIIYLKEQGQWLTTSYASLVDAQFAPVFTDADYLTLTCRYDIYTSDGTKRISEDRWAENRLTRIGGLTYGQKRTVKISINPTYIYVLDDSDAQDPTIKP
jgi:hypothetical protein